MKTIKKPGFTSNTTRPILTPITVRADGFYDFREWQLRAYRQLKPERLRLMNVPMGGGKTFAICALAYDDLLANPAMKCIICVPQRLIASGFLKHNINFPDGRKHNWAVIPENNLMGDTPDCINRFLSFLKSPVGNPSDIYGRTLLCSHQTIALAIGQLKAMGLLKNLTVFVDEAHHICDYENETTDIDVVNSIGEFVRLACGEPTNKMTLATATFFRGDRVPILPKELLDFFSKFRLPYDEYLQGMQHLRSFSYDFVLYRDNPVDALKEIYKDGIGKSIVYIPNVNSSYTFGTKKQEVNAILDVFGLPHDEDKDGLHRGRYKGKEIVAVDLVDDEADRKRRMKHINTNSKNPSGPDLIIALNMFKEGANYEALDHQCIIGPKNSLTEVVQMVGRLLRDVPGKESVKVHHLLPMTIDSADREEAREALNDYLKAILLSMMMEEVICPKLAMGEQEEGDKILTATNPTGTGEMCLTELVTDDTERRELFDKALKAVLAERALTDEKVGFERVKEIASGILTAAGYPDNEKAAECIWRMLIRRTLRMSGIDVSQVDIDLVRDVDPLGWLPKYMSEVCDVKTFRTIRDALNGRPLFLPYEEAKKVVQAAGIKSAQHFRTWKEKPDNIPTAPHMFYQLEWISWSEFFENGHGRVNYLSYEEARKAVREAGIKTQKEFRAWRPKGIPSQPSQVYRAEWKGMPEFLGNGKVGFLTYEDAKVATQAAGINDYKKFRLWKDRPKSIPSNPNLVYKSEWKGYSEFFGNENGRVDFLPYEEARKITQSARIKTWAEFRSWKGRPKNVPSHPHESYESDWKGWPEFLGNENGRVDFLPYEEARKITQSVSIKTVKEFRNWKERPKNIPATPEQTYKSEWKGWPEFLGNENGRVEYLSYEEARKVTRAVGIKTWAEFRSWEGRPKNIPTAPDRAYKSEWKGMPEFLGTENGRVEFLSYEEAKKVTRAAGIKTRSEVTNWKSRPKNIPSNPHSFYKSEWKGYSEFLGNGNERVGFLSYYEADKVVRAAGIKTQKEFQNWEDRPKNFPSAPDQTYKSEWKGWPAFLRGE